MNRTTRIAVAAGATLLAGAALAPTAWAAQAPQRSITNVSGDLYRFQNNNHYGLFLVEQIASRWGVEPLAGRNRVWFEIARA